MPESIAPRLALIVGAARSGTTLLRLILDAHPQIGCPAEAGLPSLMSHMASVWSTIDADVNDEPAIADPGEPGPEARAQADGRSPKASASVPAAHNEARSIKLSTPAREWIISSALTAMDRYCRRSAKSLYVDKSLDSVHSLDLVKELFPDVKCVLAVRHAMDTVASGIEASPWGFQAYGYAPYVQTSPGNSVAALLRYWLDHVETALEWERRNPESCTRIRYEDLVADPAASVLRLEAFLGVEADTNVVEQAFARDAPRGPGDYKVGYTSGVHSGSIGHGKRVPVAMIPPALLAAVNEKLAVLGYSPIDRSWNAAERPTSQTSESSWSRRLQVLLGTADPLIVGGELGPFALVAEDHIACRWIIDPETGTIAQGDGDVEAVLTGTAEDLVHMLTRTENLGVLLRAGRVRQVVADRDSVGAASAFERTRAMVALLQSCVKDEAVESV